MKKMFVLSVLLSGMLLGGYATSGRPTPEIARADVNPVSAASMTETGIVEDFESGTLSDQWTVDPNFGQVSDTDPTHYAGFDRNAAVSDRSTIGWVEHLPFNKDGNYFLNGWKGEGGAADEAASWRLLSQPFTLTGSGLITAKMGGNSCRLALYSAPSSSLPADAEALISIDTTPWWCDNLDMTVAGGNNVTMRRVYLDASAFLGQEVVLALEDYRAGGNWGHAFFDSINTNVELNEFKFDVEVVENLRDGWTVSKKVAFTDYYKPGQAQGNLKYVAEAYEFLSSYYSAARNKGDIFTYCELPIDDLNRLVEGYTGLSTEAKAIVDRSDDFSYAGYLNHKDTVDYEDDIVLTTVGQSMSNLNSIAETERSSTNGIFAVNQTLNGSSMVAISILAVLLIVGASLFVYLRIRKKKESK